MFELYFKLLGKVNYNSWKYDDSYIYNLVMREFNFI